MSRMTEEPAYTPRAEYQCDGSTTHYQGCKCHEARRQAEVDKLREQLAATKLVCSEEYGRGHRTASADADAEIEALREQLAVARECLQWLESGLAGMFGTQSKSPKDEFYETAPKVVHDCLARIDSLKA